MSVVPDLFGQAVEREVFAHLPARFGRLEKGQARRTVTSRTIRMFDPDQLRNAFGGQAEHRLLKPGAFNARLLQIETAEFVLDVVHYSLPVAITGDWPSGRVALCFGLNMPGGAVALGQSHHTGALALFDNATGIDAHLPAQTDWAVLILDRDRFQSEVSRCGGEAAVARATSGIPLQVRETEKRRLGNLLRAIIDCPGLTSQLLQMSGSTGAFEQEILTSYIMAFVTAELPQPSGRGSLQRRYRLIRKAERYVFSHLDESVRMRKLSREIGASARSLEYACQDIYGMGAMQYLRTVRLNEVRKALLQSSNPAPATVTAIAMDWGFWHLGEFAAAYKRLFGEVPSETLRCRCP